MKHIHAELMRLYSEDAIERCKAMLKWEEK